MKTALAWWGGFVLFLAALGTLNIGNFVLMYSPDKIARVKGVEQ